MIEIHWEQPKLTGTQWIIGRVAFVVGIILMEFKTEQAAKDQLKVINRHSKWTCHLYTLEGWNKKYEEVRKWV